jgi:nickel-dependent lactate racemase
MGGFTEPPILMLYYARGSATEKLTTDDLRHGLQEALSKIGARQRVLVVPPDFTRFHSQAGRLTRLAYDYYGARLTDILPALGTHSAMTGEQIHEMFPGVPASLFRVQIGRAHV